MLVAMSLDDLGLPSDEQARVEAIQADLLSKLRPAAVLERNLDLLLAEGLASTTIDAARVDAALEALAVSSAAAHASAATALVQLHALLTPAQRAAFTDKLEAQWELWKRANTGDQDQVAVVSKDIGLWPAQVDKVREQMAPAEAAAPLRQDEVKHHLHQLETAFQADTFDARSLSSGGELTRHLTAWGAARLARFCEAANPLLVPEQRDRLVGLLRDHAGHTDAQTKE